VDAAREVELYRLLLFTRRFEERVSRLHRLGKILGGVYSGLGQEAVCVGACAPLGPGDFVFPLHRDLGMFLARGVEPRRLMAQLMGRATGLSRGKDSFLHGGDLERGVFGATSMLASTLPVACGVAWTFRRRRQPHVSVAVFGEGAASRGDFHEALNFAAVHRLPCLFLCENNRYAYSTPIELQMAVEDVADRAAGYGMRGAVCSGNDLHAVLEAVHKGLARARAGQGPTLLECKTYRFRGHSEHDPARYRSDEELAEWRARDPIQRWEVFLGARGHDVAKLRARLEAELDGIIDDAVTWAENSPYPAGPEALEDLTATPLS
jgi:TPP-dependent pyruvate/acetoin dehydrogenase alpha subunit